MSGMTKKGLQSQRPRHKAKPLVLADLFADCSEDPLVGAFEKKSVVHPFVDAASVPEDQWDSVWRECTRIGRTGKSVAYLHIPFCENHCLFCGFYQNPWRTDQGARYTDALISELRRERDKPCQSEGPIHAVYFGGGTPSALAATDLRRILETVRETLPLAPDCEITVEGRVHSFPLDKAKACFDGGANRLSIGVQSFDTRLRRRLGRKAEGEKVVEFLEQLVREDRCSVVIDLMYGFPDQSLDAWAEDVRTAAEIGIDGIDLYALNLLQGSPLETAIDKGKFSAPPTYRELGAYYSRGAEVLARAGWSTISTTHWRRTTRERNLYNLLVKTGANCLAYGSGAGGSLNGYSFRIDGNLEAYIAATERGEKPFSFMMRGASTGRDFLNTIKGQMEVGHLDIDWLTTALAERGLNGAEVLTPVIDQWRLAGLLTIELGWARLTIAGRFWQVTMTQKLLTWLQQLMRPAQAA